MSSTTRFSFLPLLLTLTFACGGGGDGTSDMPHEGESEAESEGGNEAESEGDNPSEGESEAESEGESEEKLPYLNVRLLTNSDVERISMSFVARTDGKREGNWFDCNSRSTYQLEAGVGNPIPGGTTVNCDTQCFRMEMTRTPNRMGSYDVRRVTVIDTASNFDLHWASGAAENNILQDVFIVEDPYSLAFHFDFNVCDYLDGDCGTRTPYRLQGEGFCE